MASFTVYRLIPLTLSLPLTFSGGDQCSLQFGSQWRVLKHLSCSSFFSPTGRPAKPLDQDCYADDIQQLSCALSVPLPVCYCVPLPQVDNCGPSITARLSQSLLFNHCPASCTNLYCLPDSVSELIVLCHVIYTFTY